jgi:ABC-type transport system substrate-binding protein
LKNSKRIYAVLLMAVMLVALSCQYQPLTPLTTVSATPTTSQVDPAQNTTARVSPVLNFTLVVPKNNPLRIQYGQMVVDGLDNLGINATLSVLPFDQFISRTVGANSSVRGKTYADGGFDIACVGWVQPPDPNPYLWFDSSQFAPTGGNYYLWSNATNDYLCTRILHEMNQTKLLQLLQEEQALVYDEAPSVALYYPDYVLAVANNLTSAPIAASYDYSWPAVETWNYTSSPLTSVTVAQNHTDPTYFGGFAQNLGNGYCQQMLQAITGPIFGEGNGYGLLKRGPAHTLDVTPYMAYGNYTHSTDYRNWTFTIRPGIKFQDGEGLDARDVVYTLRYMMTLSWGSAIGGWLSGILGSNRSVYWAGEKGTPGASEPLNNYTVQFNLPENYSYFLQEICTMPIIPCSVLINSTSGIPEYSNWNPNTVDTASFQYTAFNTERGTYCYYAKNGTLCTGFTGPFGAGPYEFVNYNLSTNTLHLKKYLGYFNRTQLEATGSYRITDYYVREVDSAQDAITDLKTGSVQVLDSVYNFPKNTTWLNELTSSFCRLVVLDGLSVQEVGFNMQDPIFGTGLGTPVGKANSSQAAEAAKDMRRGIEYLFLKDMILKNMTHGYAVYGVTTPVMPAMFGFDTSIVLRNDTTLNQRLLAIKEFEAAGYHFYIDLALHGLNATSPSWTFGQYGYNIATNGAGNVSVKFYTVAPPGTTATPSGAVPVVYLEMQGFKLPNVTQTILYVYYNRTRVQSLGVNESYLALYIWNTTATPAAWSALTSTHLALNKTFGVVFAVAPHFSYFAVFATPPASVVGGGISVTLVLIATVAVILVLAGIVLLKKRSLGLNRAGK